MQKIAISGGKGGTGKSTFAVLFANRQKKDGQKVVLADLDVEAPNIHLLLGRDIGNAKKNIYAEFPVLEREKCKKCDVCIKTCFSHAIFRGIDGYPVFVKELCSACGACMAVCPWNAITAKKEKTGEIFADNIKKDLTVITGRSLIGVEETGPIVRETKKYAVRVAEKINADLVIFDTAPGTHCPVISALLSCDLAYAVTEPTPMGAHDLALILDLCKKLRVPVQVVVNKADLGDKEPVLSVVRKFGTKIAEELNYSEKIVRAYSKGKLLEYDENN